MRVYFLEAVASLALGGFILAACQPAAAEKPKATTKKDTCSVKKGSGDDEDETSSDESDDDSDDEGANLLADVTYDGDVKSIMTSKCTSCHSADAESADKQEPYLTSASEIETNITKVISEMRNGSMPAGGGAEADADVLEAWKDGGFEGSGGSSDEDEDGGSSSGVFYNDQIKDLLADNCVTCHSADGDSPDLSSYSKAKSAADDALEAIQDGSMPQDGSLSDSDKEAFAAWVNADMPESDEDGTTGSNDDDESEDDDEVEDEDDDC